MKEIYLNFPPQDEHCMLAANEYSKFLMMTSLFDNDAPLLVSEGL
jgi:hypothetical protein